MKSKGALSMAVVAVSVFIPRSSQAVPQKYLIGAGIHDVTGPAADVGMMGYAMIDQRTAGIHMRQRSRAFVVVDAKTGKRVVFVSVDLGQVFQGVKLEVVEKLAARFGTLYTSENVLLSATHTHSGAGGFSHHALYNLTTFGYSPRNFAAIVEGIYQSIVKAHDNLEPGTIRIASGDLLGVSVNRSAEAYKKNPDAGLYPYDTDKTMTVLKVLGADGSERGTLNWFAVHGTSIGNKNRLISGDNKGYASYLFERLKGASPLAQRTFVAAFAQSNEGDVSPNVLMRDVTGEPSAHLPLGTALSPDGRGGGVPATSKEMTPQRPMQGDDTSWDGEGGADDFLSVEISGKKQFEKALELYTSAQEPVRGAVDYRHAYVDMSSVRVDARFTDGEARNTCYGAIGISMLAGTVDGLGFGKQGVTCDNVGLIFKELACDGSPDAACHAEKPIAVKTGLTEPYPWTPQIVPVQILTIGQLTILGVPAELTTMAGRRLRDTVHQVLGANHVVIAGLSNAYAGYVATREEYAIQRYEGASTHFGPWTLSAYQQELEKLALALKNGTPVAHGPDPLDLSNAQEITINDDPGVDFLFLPRRPGNVKTQPRKLPYRPGDTATVEFWGGHLSHDFKTQSTFLSVDLLENGTWRTVARDGDPETKLRWSRDLLRQSTIAIDWTIPADARPGTYRIVHYGNFQYSAGNGSVKPYTGITSSFQVGPNLSTEREP